jgi:hypothetical protein
MGRAVGSRVMSGTFNKGCERRDGTSTGWAPLNAGVEKFSIPPTTAHTWRSKCTMPPLWPRRWRGYFQHHPLPTRNIARFPYHHYGIVGGVAVIPPRHALHSLRSNGWAHLLVARPLQCRATGTCRMVVRQFFPHRHS